MNAMENTTTARLVNRSSNRAFRRSRATMLAISLASLLASGVGCMPGDADLMEAAARLENEAAPQAEGVASDQRAAQASPEPNAVADGNAPAAVDDDSGREAGDQGAPMADANSPVGENDPDDDGDEGGGDANQPDLTPPTPPRPFPQTPQDHDSPLRAVTHLDAAQPRFDQPPSGSGRPPRPSPADVGTVLITLRWVDNSDGEDGYRIHGAATADAPMVLLATVAANVETATVRMPMTLTSATQRFRFAVSPFADGALNTSDLNATTELEFTPTIPRNSYVAPTGLRTTDTNGDGVRLIWNDNSANEPVGMVYGIYESIAGGSYQLLTTVAPNRNFVDIAGSPCESRSYMVRYLLQGDNLDAITGSFSFSNAVSVAGAAGAPTAPDELIAWPDPNGLRIFISFRNTSECVTAFGVRMIEPNDRVALNETVPLADWERVTPDGLAPGIQYDTFGADIDVSDDGWADVEVCFEVWAVRGTSASAPASQACATFAPLQPPPPPPPAQQGTVRFRNQTAYPIRIDRLIQNGAPRATGGLPLVPAYGVLDVQVPAGSVSYEASALYALNGTNYTMFTYQNTGTLVAGQTIETAMVPMPPGPLMTLGAPQRTYYWIMGMFMSKLTVAQNGAAEMVMIDGSTIQGQIVAYDGQEEANGRVSFYFFDGATYSFGFVDFNLAFAGTGSVAVILGGLMYTP